ncbi:MAG TPA: TrkA family potassium uptake protein [Candidatus Acidoferrales bacterium]|nr:TrkA family potassium uptake protein [Candidatus Acidoferrales bacterium]
MKIVIVGCGRVGAQVAADMDRDGHEVTIVDRSPSAFALFASRGVLSGDFKGNELIGDGTDADVLRRAGIEEADAFIAVTEGDNRNIMASQIAQHVFKVPRVVCRIYDPVREEVYRKLGVHTFCPTIEGTRTIHRMVVEK